MFEIVGGVIDIMCEVDPKHLRSVFIENREKVLYLQLLQEIYSIIGSVLMWYELYALTLNDTGFVINPYDI